VPIRRTFRLRHRDGRTLWVREEAVVVRDRDGSPRTSKGFFVDVTELKNTEAALRESQERIASSEALYRTVVEGSPDMIAVIDDKGTGQGDRLRLATVYGIVTQFGGTIDVFTEPGQGRHSRSGSRPSSPRRSPSRTCPGRRRGSPYRRGDHHRRRDAQSGGRELVEQARALYPDLRALLLSGSTADALVDGLPSEARFSPSRSASSRSRGWSAR
jgi:hypothetical protein